MHGISSSEQRVLNGKKVQCLNYVHFKPGQETSISITTPFSVAKFETNLILPPTCVWIEL